MWSILHSIRTAAEADALPYLPDPVGGAAPPRRLFERELGLGVADDAAVALRGLGLGHDLAVTGLLHGRGDNDLLLGDPHAPELDRQAPQRARIARRLGVRPGDLRHRVEAVEDVAGQAHSLRELGIDVDRVEVARRARVAVREVFVRGDMQLGQRVALLQISELAQRLTLPSRCSSTYRERSACHRRSWIRTGTRRSPGRPSRTRQRDAAAS